MPEPIVGLHHVTAIASDPQRNLDFYCEVLGLRFVKRTVNFDDPGLYHFYFGDDIGSPGTILTFFIRNCVAAGIQRSSVAVCGFSQGACLATESIARHPAHYGALIAFTGGLVGPSDLELQHDGSLTGTRALFSSGDPDPHVPWSRVEASARELERMGAQVQLLRHTGRPHTIVNRELEVARPLILSLL